MTADGFSLIFGGCVRASVYENSFFFLSVAAASLTLWYGLTLLVERFYSLLALLSVNGEVI